MNDLDENLLLSQEDEDIINGDYSSFKTVQPVIAKSITNPNYDFVDDYHLEESNE